MLQVEVNIRVATQVDIDSLILLRAYLLDGTSASYSSRSPEDTERWRATYRDWLTSRLKESDCVLILAAEHRDSGDILGCATGIIDQRAPAPGSLNGLSGWVQSVVVSPQWRKRGVAWELMQHLLRWFSNRGIATVALQSTTLACSLYESLGFVGSGERLLLRQEAQT
ncbi:Acetyltransferase (GNAT) family protein [compost metagenome]